MIEIEILIPIANTKNLEKTLKSIKEQSYQNFHITAIFNGTKVDDSYFKIFSNGKYTCLEIEEKGISQALNFGLNNSTSEFIARIDVGDLWIKEHLEITRNYLMTHKDIDFVSTKRKVFSNFNNLEDIINPEEIISEENSFELHKKLYIYNYITHSSVFFRRSLLEDNRYDKEFNGMEDWKLWIDIITDMNSAYLNQTTVYYEINEGELEEKYPDRFSKYVKLIDYIKRKKSISNYDYVKLRRKYLGK